MNYFDFYELPVSFQIDQSTLKRTFYTKSKKYHPDFYTLESSERQAEILALSSLNNEAYATLRDFDKRMKYILDQTGSLGEEGKNKIPQDFLMEMMDINEGLMELEFDFDANQYAATQALVQAQLDSIYAPIAPLVEQYDASQLEKIKDYYLKKRYLLRIQNNLSKFASR